MKILVAPDKFKNSLSAPEVSKAIQKGLLEFNPSLEINLLPLADGGEGSIDILASKLNLKQVELTVEDPLGSPVSTYYFVGQNSAYIELAKASGLTLLTPSEKDPLKTSTRGTGMLVKDAIERGTTKIYLFIGGSATNDAGIGIASVLGFDFLDEHGELLDPCGASLAQISKIQYPREFDFEHIEFYVLCDVENVLFGEQGASFVFAPQKGAGPNQVELLDTGLRNFAHVIAKQFDIQIAQLKGGGAAGGIGAGLNGLLQADLLSASDFIFDLLNIDQLIQTHDMIISGEGLLDESSFQGKVVGSLVKKCNLYQKPISLLVGRSLLPSGMIAHHGIDSLFEVINFAPSNDIAMKNAPKFLEHMAFQWAKEMAL